MGNAELTFALAGYVLALIAAIAAIKMALLCDRLKSERDAATWDSLDQYIRISNAKKHFAKLRNPSGSAVKINRILGGDDKPKDNTFSKITIHRTTTGFRMLEE